MTMPSERLARARAARRAIALPLALSLVLAGLYPGPWTARAETLDLPEVLIAANVFHPEQPLLDHLMVIVDKVIDPTSIPAPVDFALTFDGAPIAIGAVSFVYAGFAGPGSAVNRAGISLIRLDIAPLPIADLYLPDREFTLVYAPGAAPIRDRALNEAAPATVEVLLFDAVGQELAAGTIDHDYGADKLLLFTNQPFDLGSIPDPGDFSVTIDGNPYGPVAVSAAFPDVGMGVIELTLSQPVGVVEGYARVVYAPGVNRVIGRHDGVELEAFDIDWVYFFLPANEVFVDLGAAPGTATTASVAGVSESDPVATTVYSPTGGTVTISERPLSGAPPPGYVFFGQLVEITAPDATDPADPLVLTFDVHASLVPAGESAQTIEILRNDVPVPNCAPSAGETPVADPSPCVSARVDQPNGDVSIVVATLQASRWNFALRTPVAFDGFFAPVDNHTRNGLRAGAAVPLRFSLGGDRGLDVFAAGSPSSRPVACDTQEPYDEVETTVTAGKSGLTYDAASDRYTYVWKTSSAWTGCRRLSMTFVDGTTVSVTFQFRR
jgi:hypothetical protein